MNNIARPQLGSPDYFAGVPLLAVDVPAGWDPARGPPRDGAPCARPETLVSLAAPKRCVVAGFL